MVAPAAVQKVGVEAVVSPTSHAKMMIAVATAQLRIKTELMAATAHVNLDGPLMIAALR